MKNAFLVIILALLPFFSFSAEREADKYLDFNIAGKTVRISTDDYIRRLVREGIIPTDASEDQLPHILTHHLGAVTILQSLIGEKSGVKSHIEAHALSAK